MLIQRPTYLNQIVSKKGNGLIKIISGLRRCGKSYLLFKLFKKHLIDSGVNPDKIITIELDDFKQAQYRDPKTC